MYPNLKWSIRVRALTKYKINGSGVQSDTIVASHCLGPARTAFQFQP